MKWFRRNRQEEIENVTDDTLHGTSLDEARAARRLSEAGLRHAQQRDASVRAAGSSMRALRTGNGFAADFRFAMGRRGTDPQ